MGSPPPVVQPAEAPQQSPFFQLGRNNSKNKKKRRGLQHGSLITSALGDVTRSNGDDKKTLLGS